METNLVDKWVIVFAANYIYEGKLIEETFDAIFLHSPSIIYRTGNWDADNWLRSERLPLPWIRLERSAVESMGPLDRSVLQNPVPTP